MVTSHASPRSGAGTAATGHLARALPGLLLALVAVQPAWLHAADSPQILRDCPTCPEMVVIPAGKFRMGEDGGEEGRYEGPVREVTIGKRFALGRFEVTHAQYAEFVRLSGHRTAGTGCNAIRDGELKPLPNTSWQDPGYGRPVRDEEPVTCVRWSDAQAYAAWLAGRTGKKYRLPSEAQWEYAARAGTTTRYTWGDELAAACKVANVYDQSALRGGLQAPYPPAPCDDGYPGVAPVGRFAPNAFGLHDMIGNVWEWVEDCYEMPYSATPADGSAQLTRGCERRGSKSGAWRSDLKRMRPAFRGRDPEALTSQIFGFRVARELD
jgi:formylglycine-generating enzyme required for sulfatase activity